MSDKKEKRFITVPALAERWSCSGMHIERLLDDDPDFPPEMRLGPKGRTRLFDVDLIEAYERASIVPKQKKVSSK